MKNLTKKETRFMDGHLINGAVSVRVTSKKITAKYQEKDIVLERGEG